MVSLREVIDTIREIDLKLGEVEILEDCESVTNIMIGPVLDLLSDQVLRDDVIWLQNQHRKANDERWGNIVELAESLFKEAGGGKRVKKYHSIEAACREASLEEIVSIEDPEIRKTILKVRHIHDNMRERMAGTIAKTYRE